MTQRGRKSGAALALVSSHEFANSRPAAPDSLTKEQAIEWDAVVNRMPPDWFPRETHGILEQYVRHVTRARALGVLLDKHDKRNCLTSREYATLLRQESIQSKLIASLATKMRLSQQSTYDKSKKKDFDPRQLPCEIDDYEEDDEEETVAG